MRMAADLGPELSIAVATVCTDDFLPGVLVTLHSFAREHPTLNVDYIVIHDGLSELSKAVLSTTFDRLTFRSPSDELTARLDALCRVFPDLSKRRARFLSAELLQIQNYDRVLFCDGDLLFRASIADLFARDDALICAGDLGYYRGIGRRRDTFEICDRANEDVCIRNTFNAGLMLFQGEACTQSDYAEMLNLLTAERWQHYLTGHTDQILFNLIFEERAAIVGAEFNYLLGHAAPLIAAGQTPPTNARVLHFNGPIKPWTAQKSTEPSSSIFSFKDEWKDVLKDVLQQYHHRREAGGGR